MEVVSPATKRGLDKLHIPPCSRRFEERVFSGRYEYVPLCRCCGRLMFGRRDPFGKAADPLCDRCEKAQG